MVVPDFKQRKPPRNQKRGKSAGDFPIERKPVLAPVERLARFALHLGGEGRDDRACDIGRVGKNRVEARQVVGQREQVRHACLDAAGNAVSLRVLASQGDGGGREVERDAGQIRTVRQDRNPDAARTATEVGEPRPRGKAVDCLFNQPFGVGTRNQNVGRDAVGLPIERRVSEQIGKRRAGQPLFEQIAELRVDAVGVFPDKPVRRQS